MRVWYGWWLFILSYFMDIPIWDKCQFFNREFGQSRSCDLVCQIDFPKQLTYVCSYYLLPRYKRMRQQSLWECWPMCWWCGVIHVQMYCGIQRNTLWREWVTFMPHDDVIKWKHFPRYWSIVRGIHRSPVNSPHKGQCRGALIFSLISACINDWVNNRRLAIWDAISPIMTSL